MIAPTLVYVFVVPGILAAFGAMIWLDSWRRNRLLDAEIAAYRAARRENGPTGRRAGAAGRTVARDNAALARLKPSWARDRKARTIGLRLVSLRSRERPSDFAPGE